MILNESNNSQDREIRFKLQKLRDEIKEASNSYEKNGNTRQTYYMMDYIIKDAKSLSDYIKKNNLK